MSTPAERVYEAAAGNLADQQAKAARFTSALTPLAATATAGALLLEPATNGIPHAGWLQVTGLVVGSIGLLVVFFGGINVLAGPYIPSVQPNLLYQTAKRSDSLENPDKFHLEAAAALAGVWEKNRHTIKGVVWGFRVFVLGLVLEIVGLGVAALVRPDPAHATTPAPAAASLHLISGYLNRRAMGVTGEIAAGAQGKVYIEVSLLGRTGRATLLKPSIHDGRFVAHIKAPNDLAPLRSASYTITWAGSSAVASAYLAGTIARCPKDCQ